MGCRTEVRSIRSHAAIGMSSYPATHRSSGTAMPSRKAASWMPNATRSLTQKTARGWVRVPEQLESDAHGCVMCVVALGLTVRRNLDPVLRQRADEPLPAFAAGADQVVSADDRYVGVTVGQEVLGHEPTSADVVAGHLITVQPRDRAVDENDREALGHRLSERWVGRGGCREDQPVDGAALDRLHRHRRAGRLVGRPQRHPQVCLGECPGESVEQLGVERVGDSAGDDTHEPGPSHPHRSGLQVGYVASVLERLEHALSGALLHISAVLQDSRHRALRDTGDPGDVAARGGHAVSVAGHNAKVRLA